MCECGTGLFVKNQNRDMYIIVLYVLFILAMIYIWMTLYQSDSLDNRPLPWLGGLKDGTGETNMPSYFARGYGVKQSK